MDQVVTRARHRPSLNPGEVAIAGAALVCVAWELYCRLGPLADWPGGLPFAYTLLPAAIIGLALWFASAQPEAVRVNTVLVVIGLEALGLLLVHRWLGPDDGEIAVLYARYGHHLLDTAHLPVAEYPPLALVLLAVATFLGSPPITLPLLTLPLLLASGWVISRVAAPAAWAAAAVLLWPTLLGYWEIRFDAAAAGLLAIGLFCATRDRWAWAGALLAAGAFIKWYPALAVLPLVVVLVRAQDWRRIGRVVAGFAGVTALSLLPFAFGSPIDALTNPYRFQSARTLTGESLPYTLLHLVGQARTDDFPWEAVSVSHFWVGVSLAVQLLSLVAVAAWAWSRPQERWRAAALAPLVGLAVNRVFSAQFNLFVFVALGLLLALSRLRTLQRRQLTVLLAVLAVVNYAVFPGNVTFWFPCKLVYWVGLVAVLVVLLRSPAEAVPDPQE